MSEFDFYCQDLETDKIEVKNKGKIHFIGAGGVGMYSLVMLSRALGFSVSGSDRDEGEYIRLLKEEGVEISIGHKVENIENKELVVYSLAVAEDNPELLFARKNHIKTVTRPAFLGFLMKKYKNRIGVSGTHGKTTTTAMLDRIFSLNSSKQTTLLGSVIPGEHTPLRLGGKELLLYEACEYRDAFLSFSPTASVFTNLELDHVDYFKSAEQIKESFRRAMEIPKFSVINLDSPWLREVSERVSSKCVGFGESPDAEYRITEISKNFGIYSFSIEKKCKKILTVNLSIPGRFNVYNAAAAAVMALEYGVESKTIEKALCSFKSPPRRLEKIGEYNGDAVYYDYAHHPTEIEATLNTLREMTSEKITVVFKPHTYSRTAGFLHEFAKALSLADRILICDISAIREKIMEGVSSEKLASLIGNKATRVEENGISKYLTGGVTVIMGAADLNKVKDEILR